MPGTPTARGGPQIVGSDDPNGPAQMNAIVDWVEAVLDGDLTLGATLRVLGQHIHFGPGGVVRSTLSTSASLRSNYNPATDRLLDTASPSWAINVGGGADDKATILRAPATTNAPVYVTLFTVAADGTVSVVGDLTVGDDLAVADDATVAGDLAVGGTVTGGEVKVGSAFAVVTPVAEKIINGAVNSNGTIARGSGFGVSKVGTGTYALTWSAAFSAAPTVTLGSRGATITAALTIDPTTGAAEVTMSNASGTAVDAPFHFIAIGPR